jgi:hypothetical protein
MEVMVGGEDMERNLHIKVKLCKFPRADSGYIPAYRINNYVIPKSCFYISRSRPLLYSAYESFP